MDSAGENKIKENEKGGDPLEETDIKQQVAKRIEEPDYRPETVNEIGEKLGVGPDERPQFRRVVAEMEENGLLVRSRNGRVRSLTAAGCVAAVVRNLTKTGGFATPDGGDADFFIERKRLAGAMPTDTVLLRPLHSGDRAEVVKVLRHNFTEFTGTFELDEGRPSVRPDAVVRSCIQVLGAPEGVRYGDKVLASYQKGEAVILSGFGPSTAAASCCRAVLAKYHIHPAFPADVLAEAKKASGKKEDAVGRLDLRDEVIFTIDGADSKDLDDAVSVKRLPDGWKLGVHIADVSHYVRPGSALDREALRRGTSIYFAQTVIPMLPKELSNGICSLNPQEDRFAVSALMTLDENGGFRSCEFHKSVIRSRVKGVYEEINRMFDGGADEEIRHKYAECADALVLMRQLASVLSKRRADRGTVDIESDDCKITVDEEGRAVKVEARKQGEAERMIEEFMLCANEAVASFAVENKMPLVFRVHDSPEPKKIDELAKSLRAAGIDAREARPGMKPKDFSKLWEHVAASGKADALSTLLLRAMAKARYSPDCTGHFGLALDRYCHFTSPIRRYPDLATHRILSDLIAEGPGPGIVSKYRDYSAEAAALSSQNEVNAMQVERGCDDCYKAEFMRPHVGERFEGVVSTVQTFGFYIKLANTVEGLCRLDEIPGTAVYDETRMAITAGGKTYSLGDRVSALLTRADTATGQIDFSLRTLAETRVPRNGAPRKKQPAGPNGHRGGRRPRGHGRRKK